MKKIIVLLGVVGALLSVTGCIESENSVIGLLKSQQEINVENINTHEILSESLEATMNTFTQYRAAMAELTSYYNLTIIQNKRNIRDLRKLSDSQAEMITVLSARIEKLEEVVK